MKQFIGKVKNEAKGIRELNGYILHELIDTIYVRAPDKSSGHRRQEIHIKYAGVGFIPLNGLMNKRA